MKKNSKQRKKILFIGYAQSSHTQAWVDLLSDSDFDIRVFGINNIPAPNKINFNAYNFDETFPFIKPGKLGWWHLKYQGFLKSKVYNQDPIDDLEKLWLSWIINRWQPDIVHTLGIDPSTLYYWQAKEKFKIFPKHRLVVTIRGGSDLELNRFDKAKIPLFKDIFTNCDYAIADNIMTYQYACLLGLNQAKKAPFGFMSGMGGVDVQELSQLRKKSAWDSRIILWPKAYEGMYSKGLPILEALKIAWDKISPCKVIMTSIGEEGPALRSEIIQWLDTMPVKIRKNIQIHPRINRQELLKIMAKSRVVLAPSLVDGVPNTMYEAMATKTFPIISPLPTIKTVIGKEDTIFARNLYPHEIARALVRAMSDDKLVEKTVENNFIKVQGIANRKNNREKIKKFYNGV